MVGDPAFLNTIEGLKKIPEPITIPITRVMDSSKPISFFSVFGELLIESNSFDASRINHPLFC
ncbi:hypothetical protein [Clostridium sp. CM027]|uniref:hypothetical protein n=1 Tax=Clostridium sp. CM027 TaxID=2849865 RepID=UPI0028690458|nr:hypothetical protein [Clostridium sp. CM027]